MKQIILGYTSIYRPSLLKIPTNRDILGQVQQIASMASGLKSDKDSVMKAVQKLNTNIEKVFDIYFFLVGK